MHCYIHNNYNRNIIVVGFIEKKKVIKYFRSNRGDEIFKNHISLFTSELHPLHKTNAQQPLNYNRKLEVEEKFSRKKRNVREECGIRSRIFRICLEMNDCQVVEQERSSKEKTYNFSSI